jgi:hypothetical protein
MEQELKNNKLELNPWEFDQSPHGWREVLQVEGFEKAAELIIYYIFINKEKILNPKPGEKTVSLELMYFHIGQMLAMDGKKESIEYFNKSFGKNSPCWNAYVDATIGFLEQDQDRIKKSIEVIESSSSEEKFSGNIEIVKNFLKALQEGVTDCGTVYSMPRG